jgi:TonB family protein
MSLQKKCLAGSAGVHVLLIVIALVGPAFLPAPSRKELVDIMTVIPLSGELTDGASNPGAGTPAPPSAPPTAPPTRVETPPPPLTPTPPPVEEVKQPVKPIVKQPVELPEATKTKAPVQDPNPIPVAVKPQKSKVIDVSTTMVKRTQAKPVKPNSNRTPSDTDAADEARAAEQWKQALGNTASRLRSNSSGSVSANSSDFITPVGGGGGGSGKAMINYATFVREKYLAAWVLPPTAPELTVEATITIGRDGNVISARISRPSGNTTLDASVRRALDEVQYVAPFPGDSTDAQRTYKLIFTPEAKRLFGMG